MLDIRDHGGKLGGGGLKVKSIQRGDLLATSAGAQTVTINTVNTAKTIVFWNASWTKGTTGGGIQGDFYLENSTTLRANLETTSSTPNIYLAYDVVEFENVKSIQRIAYRFSTGYPSAVSLTIQSVNPAKTFVYSNLKNKKIQLTSSTVLSIGDLYGNESTSRDEFIYVVEME